MAGCWGSSKNRFPSREAVVSRPARRMLRSSEERVAGSEVARRSSSRKMYRVEGEEEVLWEMCEAMNLSAKAAWVSGVAGDEGMRGDVGGGIEG